MTVVDVGAVALDQRTRVWRRVVRQPAGVVCLIFLAALVISVIAAPLLAPYDPLAQDLHTVLATPSARHVLGTDNLGRDIVSRLLYGGRVTLVGVVYAVGVVVLLGVPVGLAVGYLGGRTDAVVARAIDVVLAVPVIITLLVVVATFGQNETAAMIAFGLLGAPSLIRIVRGGAIAVRRELYVTAARASGLSARQIIRMHILPRVAGPVFVFTFLFAGGAVVTESGLAFLGLGVQEPAPSWGGMINTASTVINMDPWMLVPPGLVIALTVLALGILGDVVRDATVARATVVRSATRRRRARAIENVCREVAPEAPEALLSVRDLSVAFANDKGNQTIVVQDISFDIRPGETLGLVGESGSGKTITGKAILGLLPVGGEIVGGACLFDGRHLNPRDSKEYRKLRGSEIAMISQEPVASLDPNFTVGSQIAQVVRRHHRVTRSAARARTLELLRRVKLPDPAEVARRYPHQISGGMAQRVGIAAALAGNPRLLIADEPTTALDVTVQAEILDLLRELQLDTGMSILLVTHDWGVVADMCQRAIVMYAGQVVESTEVEEMFDRPLHPYTQDLMRSNPHDSAVGEQLPTIAGVPPRPGEWPAGCRFHPRCTLATADCAVVTVALVEPGPGRLTRCIHHESLLSGVDRR